MFFNLILLNRQHQGRFGYAWIAATRGIQYVDKKDVLSVDVCQISKDILQYVCSESDSPRARFSLRLSAVLINGAVKLLRQQTVYFLDDLIRFMTHITRPISIVLREDEERGMFETPPSPVPRKRGKKRPMPSPASTPQSDIERIISSIRAKERFPIESLTQEPLIFPARADEVTLHEGYIQREAGDEDFGPLGVFPTEEELLKDILQLEGPVQQSPLALLPIEEVPEPPVQASISRRLIIATSTSSSEPETGPVRITIEAQVHAPAEAPAIAPAEVPIREPADVEMAQEPPERPEPFQPSEAITEAPPEDKTPREPERPRRVLVEMQDEAVQQIDKQIAPRRKKVDKDLENLLISTKPTRIVRINRCEPKEVDWIDINPCPLPQFKLKTPNLTHLLDLYMVRERVDVPRRREASEASVEHFKSPARLTPPARLSAIERVAPPTIERVEEAAPLPEIRVSEVAQVPGAVPEEQVSVETPQIVGREMPVASTPVRRSVEVEQRTIEEVMAAPEEHLQESPRKKRRLFLEVEAPPGDLDFITLPSELISREWSSEAAVISEQLVESVLLPMRTPQERQQNIVNQVFARGRLTLEEVCQKPINRLNIARSFNDVLVLCKHKYVILISEDDSSELKFVDRGPKMMG